MKTALITGVTGQDGSCLVTGFCPSSPFIKDLFLIIYKSETICLVFLHKNSKFVNHHLLT